MLLLIMCFKMIIHAVCAPSSFDRQHLSYDGCLEVRGEGDYQNCSLLYHVLKLCIVISTLR